MSFSEPTAIAAVLLTIGGLNTPLAALRNAAAPAGVLATFGVAGTALAVACGARLLGFSWITALLVGAVVSSTDAAAVFSVLRSSGLQLRRRLGATLELESGLNDPLTVLLTTAGDEPAPPPAILEINSLTPLSGDILGCTIAEPTAACGAKISQLPFPPGANVMLLIRGHELMAPKGDTLLEPGDHLFVFCKPEDRPFIDLLFGRHD